MLTAANPKCIVVHKCNTHASKCNTISHHEFYCDHVFDASCSNSNVYTTAAAPLVSAAVAGEPATLFVSGEPKSGKSHTWNAAVRSATEAMFEALPTGTKLKVSCWEVLTGQCYDLLNNRQQLEMAEHALGYGDVIPALMGVVECSLRSPLEVLKLVEVGQKSRTASPMTSHFVLRVTVPGHSAGGAAQKYDCTTGGCLTFVELGMNFNAQGPGGPHLEDDGPVAALALWARPPNAGVACTAHLPSLALFTDPRATGVLLTCVAPTPSTTVATLGMLGWTVQLAGTAAHVMVYEQDVPHGLAMQIQGPALKSLPVRWDAGGMQQVAAVPSALDSKGALPMGARSSLCLGGVALKGNIQPAPVQRGVDHGPAKWSQEEVQEWLQEVSGGRTILYNTSGLELLKLPEAKFVQASRGNLSVGAMVYRALQEQCRTAAEDIALKPIVHPRRR